MSDHARQAAYQQRQDAAQAVADDLTTHGDLWADHLPADATLVNHDDGHAHATIRLADADGTLIYRRTADVDPAGPYWVVCGWSTASQSRRYRPVPADQRPWTFDEHDPS